MGVCSICEKEFPEEGMKSVIRAEGIVFVCNGCFSDDMPLFNRPRPENFEGIYKRKSVYKRLLDAAGLSKEEPEERISDFGKDTGLVSDGSLRKIANKNFDSEVENSIGNSDLIENFHWKIMRARRARKISQKQFADEIREPDSAIVKAEKGFIPEGSTLFVRKIESFLNIKISKSNSNSPTVVEEEVVRKEVLDRFRKENQFDPLTNKILRVSDLNDSSESDDFEEPGVVKEDNKPKERRGFWPFRKKNKSRDVIEEDFEFDEKDLS